MRTLHLAVLVAIALAGFAVPATAQEQRDNLTGIGSIYVVVEPIRSDAERDGLRTTMLQTAVELRLRQNGIPIADAPTSVLHVQVDTNRHSQLGGYAFCTVVTLVTTVQVEATGRTVYAAGIWSVGSVGSVGTDNVRQIRDYVLDYVDQFSNEYLAVNPG